MRKYNAEPDRQHVIIWHMRIACWTPKAKNTNLEYIRRWDDKFCLHCNVFIYIRHIWIKPVLCSRMVSLFHHTSPWTHRCLQSSLIAHRNLTACCYWILNRGKSSSNWNSQTNARRLCCQCADVSTVRRWVRRFKDGELGQADLSDKIRSVRPVTASDQLHEDRVEEMIRVNRRIKQNEIAVASGISKERVGHIIGVLGFRNTSSTRQRQASHKCSNKGCNSTPGLFSAAASTI